MSWHAAAVALLLLLARGIGSSTGPAPRPPSPLLPCPAEERGEGGWGGMPALSLRGGGKIEGMMVDDEEEERPRGTVGPIEALYAKDGEGFR